MDKLLPLALFLAGLHAVRADDGIVFNRDIRPILSEQCFHCHGPDEKTRKATLRLDVADEAYAEAITPFELEQSEFWERISTDDPDDVMPPPKTGKTLSAEQVDLLKRWIETGAEYQEHWAFEVPERPLVPPGQLAIDYFAWTGIAKAGLTPTPRAGRHVQLRRLSLDLTGLPPSTDALAAFLADESPEAWERAVDRLLASPHYGEHMARFWLDAARYGDTHGLHLDNYREIWPYRDWVVRAFNGNKRWDTFLTEQLAGDLLENPTVDQLVATGFNRAHVTTAEGGSIKEEVYVRNVIDRVSTFGTVMLGLTTNCASCHDHKFDPISQREFYQLFAFFNNLDADPMDGNRKDHKPVLKVPGPDGERLLAEAEAEIAAARKVLEKVIGEYDYVELDDADAADGAGPEELVWIDEAIPSGAQVADPWKWVTKSKGHPVLSGERSVFRTGAGNTQHLVQNASTPLVVGEDAVLFAHVYLGNPAPKQVMLQFHTDGWEHRAYWGENLIDWGVDKTPSRHRIGDLPETGSWVRLEVPAAVVGLKAGDKITGWAFTQFDGNSYWDQAGMRARPTGYRSFRRWLADERKRKTSTLPAALQPLVAKAKRTAEETATLRHHYIAHVDRGARKVLAPHREAIAKAEARLAEIEKGFPTSLVWKERATLKPAYILERGEYDRRGQEVSRGLPEFLPPLPVGAPMDRLGLARWLVAEEHPLTARIAVNRFWQQLFGVGLVKTSEDLGSQGEWPSHPELLDWLAVEFREAGWDVKHMMKLMVMSEAYRRSSAASPEDYRRDPENRFLARGPRFRLDAETLRDQALAVSGLLVPRIGGPGVKPPQPDGLWFTVGYSGSNTVRFKKDSGPDKVHRRSLYTFWKRTSPPPQMIDAPSRESCVTRRERTNTPLHALMFMNDPQFVEAARAFAERFEAEEDAEIPARLFETALARPPAKDELELLHESFRGHLAHYAADPDAAKALVAIGEIPSATDQPERLAAWTMVASLVLNLDEFVTKN